MSQHRVFRAAWWSCNVLLAVALVSLIYSIRWDEARVTHAGAAFFFTPEIKN